MKLTHLTAATAGVLAAGAILVGSARATSTSPPPTTPTTTTFVGSITSCSDTVGSVVAVNLAGADVAPFGAEDDWGGPVALGCDTSHPAHGVDLLTETGFTTAGDQHDGPGFLCRIGSALYDGGIQHPTPAQDPCVVTPPSSAYWSYWLADVGQNAWTYSPLGAYSDVPSTGEVEAWTFGGTDVQGTEGQPPFTPDQVRAQETASSAGGSGSGTGGSGAGGAGSGSGGGSEPGSSGSGGSTATGSGGTPAGGGGTPAGSSGTPAGSGGSPAGGGHAAATPSARSTSHRPDLPRAVHYLVTTTSANGLTGGTSLQRNGYYESAPGFADFGLTIDGAFALAATHADHSVLDRVVSFLARQGKDGSGRSVNSWTEIGTPDAASGAIGKEALLAEAMGRNPRSFAGRDLIGTLNRLLCTRRNATSCAGGAGSFSYGSSTFDQTLAIIAMIRARDTAHALPAIAYLRRHQHASGAWPSLIPSTGDSDVDSTAMAAMALDLVARTRRPNALARAATRAVARADRWIAHRQERDGGFPGAAGDSTNSTALAIQALRLEGHTDTARIDRALAFLAAEQNADGGFDVAATGPRSSDVRASTQVVGGIVGTSLGTLQARRGRHSG